MKNLKISRKLTVGFSIILILLVVCVAFASAGLRSTANDMDLFYDKPYQNHTRAIQIDMDSEVAAKYMLRACMEKGQTETNDMLSEAEDRISQMSDNLTKLKANYTGDTNEVAAVEACVDRLIKSYDTYKVQAQRNHTEEAYKIYTSEIVDELADITETINVVEEHASNVATESHDNAMADSQRTIVFMIVIGVLAVLIGIVLALYITRTITSATVQLEHASQRMSKGDFNVEIAYDAKDELGVLADSMREMMDTLKSVIRDISDLMGELSDGNLTARSSAEESYVGELQPILMSFEKLKERLNETVSGITNASDQVNAGSGQVSSAAQGLAQGATEQASSVQELAATVNEISQKVEDTASHAETAKEQNLRAKDEVQVCSDHMNDLVAAMQTIEEKSNEVSKVVKTIEDIAFQTNILALNAAVEAARAGSAGKGFAVVADEVRSLASKSAEAAKNTTTLIDEAIAAVANGTELSGTTEESLGRVVESAAAILEAVTYISESATEQSESLKQITVGVDQISSVVQTNSATAEESAAASQELSGQANMLKDLISIFKLDTQGTMN